MATATDPKQLKAKIASLEKLLRQLKEAAAPAVTPKSAAAAVGGERERQLDLMTLRRRAGRTVFVRKLTDEQRAKRAELEQDDEAWLRWFLPDLFRLPFQQQHKAMIKAIGDAINHGGDQALAASRSEGKSTIAVSVLLKHCLTGTVGFAILMAASGTLADDALKKLKDILEGTGDFQSSDTAERIGSHYPEVCDCVRALEGAPQRAHGMLVTGWRHDTGEAYEGAVAKFTWCGDEIILPMVPGSPSAGAIICTRGLDSPVRGMNKGTRRPDVVIIDDPDTEETVLSEIQAEKLENRIDRGIAGAGGQQRAVARVMLTTLQRKTCVSAKFTDPTQKPTWKGKRFRFLLKQPEHRDLWEEYVALVERGLQETDANGDLVDPYCRKACQFYLERREIMERGAEVANPHRFDATVLADGTQREYSALQRYFYEVARIGQVAVSTEYDNDPPEETGIIESGITPHRVQTQVSGYDRLVVPEGCTQITQGMDCRKIALHWVVRAWRPDGTGYVIDYGVFEVVGTTYGSDDGVDVAIERAIIGRMEDFRETTYRFPDGSPAELERRTLIDSRYRMDAVDRACLACGLGVYPVMGIGHSAGCTPGSFSDVQRKTLDKRPGDGWFLRRRGKLWVVSADTDRWKAWEHDRWMTNPNRPGSLQMWGHAAERGGRLSPDQRAHHAYARHICNESEIEEFKKGKMHRKWKAKSENTHWLDASYYADVAANMSGIRISGEVRTIATAPKYDRQAPLTSAQMRAKIRDAKRRLR